MTYLFYMCMEMYNKMVLVYFVLTSTSFFDAYSIIPSLHDFFHHIIDKFTQNYKLKLKILTGQVVCKNVSQINLMDSMANQFLFIAIGRLMD